MGASVDTAVSEASLGFVVRQFYFIVGGIVGEGACSASPETAENKE
jgi:hypothetical protein